MPTSALQVARTGLEAQDSRMRVIANNLANVGTTGFKRDRANFATLAYQDARVAGQRSSGETAYATGLNLGTGVAVQSTSQIMTQGTLNTTSNAFDLALDGDGYFQIEMPGGRTAYTRAGDFTLSAEGQLVTQQGYAVQPAITVPEGSTAISVSPDGIVSATLAGEGEPVELGETQRTAMRLRATWLRRALRNLIENALRYGDVARVSLLRAGQASARAAWVWACLQRAG